MELLPWCPEHHLEALATLNACLPVSGLRFVITWDVNQQPLAGRDTVLMLLGDEQSQVPLSADKVLAVFRSGTDRLVFPAPPTLAGWRQWGLEMVRFGRNTFKRIKRAVRTDGSWRVPDNVFTLPIGTMSPAPRTLIPFLERSHDVSLFASIGRRCAVGPWEIPLQPKTLARSEALKALRTMQRNLPGVQIKAGCSDDPRWGDGVSPTEYLDVLVNTRIAPCPRGNFAETFRHYEAARAGCVVISDPVPSEWYFNEHPFVILDRWSQLPGIVLELLNDANEMERRSAESVRWWKKRGCPEAVGQFMARKLLELCPELVPCKDALEARV